MVKDDSGAHAAFTEQGSSASQMTAAKDNGCHGENTRMRWTIRRRRNSFHPAKNGGRSKVAQNSKVRMSEYMDTSSTTQVAKIMVKHPRLGGSSCTKLVRSPACWPLV